LQEKEQTIQSQLAVITGYAERHGFRHSTALTYTDDGYSGTWLDRPGLDELRDHAREGRFEVVVVLCPDRLARRYAYQVLLLEELKRAGVEIHFCERPINDSPDDQLLLQIQGAIAEYERAKVLERCRRGRLHRARRGELAPPNPPYGYHYAARKYGGDGQIRIHEEEAAMVRQVFRWYAEEGASLYGLLKKLSASPWTTRRGKNEWMATSVLRMLRCEWYVGSAHYNCATRRSVAPGRDVEGTLRPRCVKVKRPRSEWIRVPVPRLVDDERFHRVQERIKENKRFSRRRLKRTRVYLLKGLLKCGLCGYAYIGMTRTASPKRDGQREHSYYVCAMRSSLRRVGCTTRCQGERLLVAGADEVVWTTVRDLLLDSDALADNLQSWLTRVTANPAGDERLSQTTGRLTELNRQRQRLIDAYQAGALDLDDFQTRKTTIEEGILAVEHELAALRSWASRRDLASRQVVGAQDVVRRLRGQLQDPSFELKQAILRLVVEKVIVNGHRLEIHLALPVSGDFHLTFGRGAICSSVRTCPDSVNRTRPRFSAGRGRALSSLPFGTAPSFGHLCRRPCSTSAKVAKFESLK
jgi:site-specific DNA recombinase